MSGYTAIVSRITTRPHPNADRLQLGLCQGAQVVVGLETKTGSLGIYFPTDGQLSHEFCVQNHLYTASARTRLGLAEGPVGFFDHKARVRAQTFRGSKSEGIWLPLETLLWTGADPATLKEGDTFTEWGGQEVCKKYLTPATLRVMKGGTPKTRREVKCFPKHDVTKQFRFVADSIPEDAVIWITEKLHGTSGRYGYVWDEEPVSWWRRITHALVPTLCATPAYRYLHGSKNVVIDP